MRIRVLTAGILAALALAGMLHAADAPAARKVDAPSLSSKPDAWFTSEEGRRVIDNILSWQGKGIGGAMGWTKAYDTNTPHPEKGGGVEWEGIATIDNGATYSELRLIARAIAQEPQGARRDKLVTAFNAGVDALLAAQYPNGGFPQRFPAEIGKKQSKYAAHITFNDNAMTRVLSEMQEMAAGAGPYGFVDEGRRAKVKTAVEKGIDCILKCQIELDGKLTGWCAQHDEETLKPANARAYELASISGSEGAAITVFLMRLPNPDERVKNAVRAAASWFDAAKIVGKKVNNVTTAEGRDRVVVDDPSSTIWARFYDMDKYPGTPMFCGRDGVKKKSLAEIEIERRRGYAWYGNWGENVAKEYAAWEKKYGGK
jgi:PelA/Pel-15E family pectate lyase